MLTYYIPQLLKCFAAFWLISLAIGYTAYRVNSERPASDPKKRNYHPFAILLAPFIFLFFAPLALVLFVLAALLYAVFILFFTLMLIAIRKPFLFVWWRRFSSSVGEPLLRIGTYLLTLPIRLIIPRAVQQPAPA
jgi:uncharacterized membrane protein